MHSARMDRMRHTAGTLAEAGATRIVSHRRDPEWVLPEAQRLALRAEVARSAKNIPVPVTSADLAGHASHLSLSPGETLADLAAAAKSYLDRQHSRN
jgi:NAD(P)-dependent dehydrogenase (short-subunit alcohol dehydrogenase family)